ncbi:hypothetical protein [Ornithinimicrobium cerasi]|uniref:hypothetical protein n=1 Tax=Ornithinimicrobium cerasi TaxID=2248773 RepID=UPI00137AADC5|nr:hypothetical protein [Ornithinimicrobium cerasi]
MTADPRAALSSLVAALERHLETAAVKRGDDDPAVVEAYERIAEAFTAYDDALMDAYGEVTPLEVFDEELEDDLDEDDDDGEDDDGEDGDLDDEDDSYVGLDDEEFDVDDRPRG